MTCFGKDSHTVNFSAQKKWLFGKVVIKPEIIAKWANHQNSALRPIADNTISATPFELARNLGAAGIEFKKLEVKKGIRSMTYFFVKSSV